MLYPASDIDWRFDSYMIVYMLQCHSPKSSHIDQWNKIERMLVFRLLQPGGSDGKESASYAKDLGSTPGLGRPPGGGHGNPLQYSCLKNPMDTGAWWAIVHRVSLKVT